jgi:Cys-tRNA(Pro) deacylase
MTSPRIPSTQAVRFLRERGVAFTPHLYRYQGGGARASAEILGVLPLRVAKTLIFETAEAEPLCVIMNGPYETSLKTLARELGKKSIEPCEVARAETLTGYRVGGISPFGQRTAMPVYMQIDLFELDTVLVNGGQRGFLIELPPASIEQLTGAELVDVAVRPRD